MKNAGDSPWIDFNLYLITDRKQLDGRSLYSVIEEALRGGVRAVQLREKDLPTKELYELAYDLRKLTARYGVKLFINDRIDITLAVDADGVHLGYNSLPVYKVRRLIGEKKLIGISCHNHIQAIVAQEKGADFISFGPVFPTPSKALYGDPVGLAKLEEVTQLMGIPVFALGGVKEENVENVLNTGVHGIALVSAIISAPEPRDVARNIISLLPPLEQGVE